MSEDSNNSVKDAKQGEEVILTSKDSVSQYRRTQVSPEYEIEEEEEKVSVVIHDKYKIPSIINEVDHFHDLEVIDNTIRLNEIHNEDLTNPISDYQNPFQQNNQEEYPYQFKIDMREDMFSPIKFNCLVQKKNPLSSFSYAYIIDEPYSSHYFNHSEYLQNQEIEQTFGIQDRVFFNDEFELDLLDDISLRHCAELEDRMRGR